LLIVSSAKISLLLTFQCEGGSLKEIERCGVRASDDGCYLADYHTIKGSYETVEQRLADTLSAVEGVYVYTEHPALCSAGAE
jgi:hypothetical protein